MWQVVLCSSWLLVCPAQIYCSVRAVSRVVWAELLLIEDICTYRINSGVAPEVMPHCAQKLFYIRVTQVMRSNCVSTTWLRDALGIFWMSHRPAVSPVMSTNPVHVSHTPNVTIQALESCWVRAAFRASKHSQLISLASGWSSNFQQAL